MRIVIDMQGAQTGSRFRGIGRCTLSLALAIARNRGKHEVVLALNGWFSNTVEPIRAAFNGLISQENIRVWNAPGPVKEADFANHGRREVAERIREAFLASLNPDVVLIFSLFEGLGDDAVTSIGILDRSTPTAVVLHDLIPLISPDAYFRTSKVHKDWYAGKIASIKRSHRLLAVSESARQEAITALAYPAQNIFTISNACDDAFRVLNMSDGQKSNLFKKYKILKPYVMYTGGPDERKNLHRLIEAYSRITDGVRQKHQLVIVGKMWEENTRDLLETALKYGLSNSDIVMTGYVDDEDLVKLYNCCTLFAFPSLHEGFGIPPLEAMLCGAPVVAANATSLPEVVGRSDALFDPNSVSSISEKIEEVLTDEAFRASLIAHGKIHAKTFSWDESAGRVIRALQDLVPARADKGQPALHVDKTSIFGKIRKKILLLKLDHMGDFVLSIPAMTKIKARYPYAKIDILVGSWNAEIAASLKIFDNIHTFDYFKKKSSDLPSTTTSEFIEAMGRLSDYDIAIDLRRQHETRFLLVETRSRLKVGYDTYDPEINARLDIGLPIVPDVPFEKTVLNSTSTAKQLLALVDALPDDVNDFVSFPELATRVPTDLMSVAIFPLAGSNAREWNKSNYTELVKLLQLDARIHSINVYFGSSAESSGFDFKSAEKLNIHIGLDFQELTRSVSSNAICVSNNSFGGHFGSYLGLTVVAIYSGHETTDEWAPVFGDSYVIHTAAPCSPCHQGQRSDCSYRSSCLSDIPVNFVYGRIMEAVDSLRSPPSGDALEKATTVSASKGGRDVVGELVSSIKEMTDGTFTSREYAEISSAISRNHAHPGLRRQLLVDVSEIVNVDARSGIQRVVRSILAELLANPPNGYQVEPVCATSDRLGYRYARGFTARFLGGRVIGADDPVEAYNGDIFVGLDLQQPTVAKQKALLQDWHRTGVRIFFVVHDLLPIIYPHYFLDDAPAAHHSWLETISHFDGVACVSRAVADDFYQWLQAFGPKRKRPFAVNWFHHGADIENSVPTKGMPENANEVLAAIRSRPTFLMVGTLEPRKGHAQALAAFEQLWSEGTRVNLVIVGKKGWLIEQFAEELRRHEKYGECLIWLDGISDEFLQEIYHSSTCLILASEGEGFGLPLIEAAQYGLPLIARDIPVLREVAGDHAYYFTNDKAPDTLANAVREWLVLHRAGKNPRSDTMRYLSWKESAKQLLGAILGNESYYAWLPDDVLRYWGNDPRLSTNVGKRFGRSMRTSAQGGYLLYGPYASLPAGRYRIVWRGSASKWSGREWLEIVADRNRKRILFVQPANLKPGQWRYEAEFVLDGDVTDIEFRMHVDEGAELTVDGIEIAPLADSDENSNDSIAMLSPLPLASIDKPGIRHVQPIVETRRLGG